MTKSKKNQASEQKAEAPKVVEKTIVKAAAPKTPAKVDPNAILTIDGKEMIWKSRTYIPKVGQVSGKVYLTDYKIFSDLVKHLSTDPLIWVSNVDEMADQKKARQREMKLRNGLS